MTDPTTIARSLTEAQRAFVLAGGYCDDKWLYGSERRCLRKLHDMKLFCSAGWGSKLDYVLTPLGKEVRTELERMNDEQ